MQKEETIHNQDMKYLWHPCSQMKDYEIFKPLVVTRALGSYIESLPMEEK